MFDLTFKLQKKAIVKELLVLIVYRREYSSRFPYVRYPYFTYHEVCCRFRIYFENTDVYQWNISI